MPSAALRPLRPPRAHSLPDPDPRLCISVAVPVRNEARALPRLVHALANQRGLDGRPLPAGAAEVLLVLNNCTDDSARVARHLRARCPTLRVAEVTLPAGEAHVGRARQLAMDAAAARLHALGRPWGLVCTTDADSRPAPTWLSATVLELAMGADAVAGRIELDARDRAALPPGVRRAHRLDEAYKQALEQLRELYAPSPHDPLPRHHQHMGASLAVRTDVYARVGGLPPVPSSEDLALYHALVASGARVRHSPHVRVATSGRRRGRAPGGLADTLDAWAELDGEPRVEPAADAERRLAALALHRLRHPDGPDDPRLLQPPHAPRSVQRPLSEVLQDLRQRVALVGRLTPSERLDRAASLHPLSRVA